MDKFIYEFAEKANEIESKYSNIIKQTGGRVSFAEMGERIEKTKGIMKELDAELTKLANELVHKYNAETTDELYNRLHKIAIEITARVAKSNTTG